MNEIYYLDSCIWRDYFENRSDNFRPLGDWALALIQKIIREESIFIFSDRLTTELKKDYPLDKLKEFFSIIPDKLILNVKTNDTQAKEAFRLRNKLNIPFGDALHAILARDNKAILISRDKHFYELGSMLKILKPEDLI
jgi:predicted nucleic acid-binding protein